MRNPERVLAGAMVFCIASILYSSLPGSGAEQKIGERFSLVMNGAAVKDNQTGLIWEQEPDREHDVWVRSNERCATKEIAGQKGWRGPSVGGCVGIGALCKMWQREAP